MNDFEKEGFIRRIANQNKHSAQGDKIIWSRHAITEAVNDELSRIDVEIALETCELYRGLPKFVSLFTGLFGLRFYGKK